MTLLTPNEVAEQLKISDDTVRRLIDSGKMEAFRVGGQFRVTTDQLHDYLQSVLIQKNRRKKATLK